MDERLDSGRPRWRFLGFDGTLRVVKEGREVLVRDVAWHVEMAMLRKTERERQPTCLAKDRKFCASLLGIGCLVFNRT
jgi:hypothetical protein